MVIVVNPAQINPTTRTLRIRQVGPNFSFIPPGIPPALRTYLLNMISQSIRPSDPNQSSHQHYEENFDFYLKGYFDLLRFNEQHGLKSFSPFVLPRSHIASHLLFTPTSICAYASRLRKGRTEMIDPEHPIGAIPVVTRDDIDEDWVDEMSPRGGLIGVIVTFLCGYTDYQQFLTFQVAITKRLSRTA